MFESFLSLVIGLVGLCYSISILIKSKRKRLALFQKKMFFDWGKESFWEKYLLITFPLILLISLVVFLEGLVGILGKLNIYP